METASLVVTSRWSSWLTGLPIGALRPAPPVRARQELGLIRGTLGPLALMAVTPPIALLAWLAVARHQGSVAALLDAGPAAWWARLPAPTPAAWLILAGFTAFELLLLKVLPGPELLGPVTPAGVQPTYRGNGVLAWAVTHAALIIGWKAGWLPVGALYERYGEVLAALSVAAPLLCLLLYAKGRLFPSTPDAVYTGNPLFDFFQGIELHPRVLGVNLKQLVNCRVSMMGWSVVFVACAIAQVERHGFLSSSMAVSVVLLVVYLLKFFVWEGGYFHSMDIMHDRFGYYICWGVLVWVPSVYCLVALWLVDHPIQLHPLAALGILAFGLGSIAVNYQADAQRQRVRATAGQATVWGRPPELIEARYTTADGVRRSSLLLASGWWGVARHFHYVPELGLAVAWTLPAGFTHALPWFYCLFLLILLVDRARRDERRCAAKYGADWERYASRVRWRMLPGIY